MLALTLLVLLVGLLAWDYSDVKAERQHAVAAEEVHRLRDAVEAYRLTTSGPDSIPTELSKVPALAGQVWIDPWGTPYAVSVSPPRVYSCGPDLVAATEDDVTAALAPVRQSTPASPAAAHSRIGAAVIEAASATDPGVLRLEVLALPGARVDAKLDELLFTYDLVEAVPGGPASLVLASTSGPPAPASFQTTRVDLAGGPPSGGTLFDLRIPSPGPGGHSAGLAVIDADGKRQSQAWRLELLPRVGPPPGR